VYIMTKIDIYSGFLGAGKTTLIKKMIREAYQGEKLVLIENEFGEIGIDGGFLQDAGINITEMNSGCICCSLVGDFGKALAQVIDEYHPDRIVIEPSGVGKLSDVIAAVEKVTDNHVVLGNTVAVADAGKVKVYMKNFGEFYNNQIETAGTIILSRTDAIAQAKLDLAVSLIRERNPHATLVTTPWPMLTGAQLLKAMQGEDSLKKHLAELEQEHHDHHHHHGEGHHCCCGHHHEHEHHHEHGEHCGCGHHHEHEHHHEHGEHCGCGHHHEHEHHHEHGEHCGCGHHHEHEHHHEHGEHCGCGHHHEHEYHHEHGEHCGCGHHHEHHHADEVFTSWGVETAKKFSAEEIRNVLHELDSGAYGMVLRAKGIVASADGNWTHFDYVPEEHDVRIGSACVIGRLCVIGSKLDEQGLARLFGV
jgi:G3E family GTPase